MPKQNFDLPLIEPRGAAESPRGVILKVILPADPSESFSCGDPTEEIRALAETAGVMVVGAVTQRRVRPHRATYVGKGKLVELAEELAEEQAKLILVDDPLTPSQGKNIEERTGVRVIDRAELIMDIFASHARTHQAKLQVELAQLRYSQPRLKRMWTHLSRFEGGIGMRGPGETQLETDRRIIRRKIQRLRERLGEIERQHHTQQKGREGTFRATLVGYTNAGKSTLMRRLTGADVLVEDRLFSTLDTSTRRWELPCARDVILSDTVGFIRNLPAHLVASFHATLLEAEEADLLLHVVDGSTPHAEADIGAVESTLRRIGCHEKPVLLLFNKLDLLNGELTIDLNYLLDRYAKSIGISAREGTGLDELNARLLEAIAAQQTECTLSLPVARGDLVARLRRAGEVLDERYDNSRVHLRARLSPADRESFRQLLARNGLPDAMDTGASTAP